jgi:hypothetical protein
VDETVDFDSGDHTFTTRVVILDMNGSGSISQAILDVETLSLEYFSRADETVIELSGRERGRWRVTTRDSSHVFDLDAMTVTRVTGTDSAPMPFQGSVPLAYIESCRVGERGSWGLHLPEVFGADGDQLYLSSLVRSIQRIPPDGTDR